MHMIILFPILKGFMQSELRIPFHHSRRNALIDLFLHLYIERLEEYDP